METIFMSYWWLLLLVASIAGYKYVLRFLFGMVIVPEDRIGLVKH